MEVVEEPFEFKYINAPHRSQGLHLTDIIKDIGSQLKLINVRDDISKEELEAFGKLGFLWEDLLSTIMGQECPIRPFEYELDGIVGSPDGISFEGDKVILNEYKCTWLSSSNTPDTVWKYMVQTKAYCKMVGTDVCIFYMFYVNGDYKTRVPKPAKYRITYTEKEIEANWNMLVKHAKRRGWLPK